MVTSSQSRAARGFLNISVKEFAKRAGLSENCILQFEAGHTIAHPRTVAKIAAAYVALGIQFNGTNGVVLRDECTEVFYGRDGFDVFSNRLLDYLAKEGGDLCLYTNDSHVMSRYRTDPEKHKDRLRNLVLGGAVVYRMLTTEIRKPDFQEKDYIQIRRIAPNTLSPTAFFACEKILALVSFANEDPPFVNLIKSASLAKSFQHSFNVWWDNAGL